VSELKIQAVSKALEMTLVSYVILSSLQTLGIQKFSVAACVRLKKKKTKKKKRREEEEEKNRLRIT
jgi:hypothetical protein